MDAISKITARFHSQKEKGLKKYGSYVNPHKLTMKQWSEHKLEEMTDELVYEQMKADNLIDIEAILESAMFATSLEDKNYYIQMALARLG